MVDKVSKDKCLHEAINRLKGNYMTQLKRYIVYGLLALLLATDVQGQAPEPFFFASQYCRDSVTKEMRAQVDHTMQLKFSKQNFSEWSGTFWAMELMLYKPAGYAAKLPGHIQSLAQASPGIQASFLEMLYTLYPKQFAPQVMAIWAILKTDRAKTIALEYLAQAGQFPAIPPTDAFTSSAHYRLYRQRWKGAKPLLPQQKDFLQPSFLPGQAVLVSFQNNNRNQPGYLMVRKANGKWLTDTKGKPMRFTQLARSISNLPYYITNGNTPQGLFRITGTDTSEDKWIGPTINLQLVMPFEEAPTTFFGSDTAYSSYYTGLLGPLAKYTGLMESYEAGKIGRTEIIAHGTTIPPQFYKGQPYFPCTPSLGCLCSPESWNAQGVRVSSVQQQWMDVLAKEKINAQWLVVTEVK